MAGAESNLIFCWDVSPLASKYVTKLILYIIIKTQQIYYILVIATFQLVIVLYCNGANIDKFYIQCRQAYLMNL
jgi:hypothetical protein